ncbi:hypothetical protein LTR22_009021 [Elasticomyces elasticus]|nr:hypothetical protein LTR22_009021 [Elasticomyces elasticus]
MHMSQRRRRHIAEIVEVVMAQGDPFGPTCSGYMRLSAPMCLVTIRPIVRYPGTYEADYALFVGPHRLLQDEDYSLFLDERLVDEKTGLEDEFMGSRRLLGILLLAADDNKKVEDPSSPTQVGIRYHEEEYQCLLVEFTREKRGQVRRVGQITLLGWPCSRESLNGRSSAYVERPVCDVLNAQFMSRDVPEDCYEEVDQID